MIMKVIKIMLMMRIAIFLIIPVVMRTSEIGKIKSNNTTKQLS